MISFNWVDIVIFIVIARYLYIAKKCELIPEFFKLMGILFATFLGIHYYIGLGKFLKEFALISETFSDFIAFLIISILVIVIFILVREGWVIILKMKMHSLFDRFLGLGLLLIRCYLICGMILFSLMLIREKRVLKSAETSLSSIFFRNTSVNVYKVFYGNIVEKFFPDESINKKAVRKDQMTIRKERRNNREKRLRD